MKKLIIANWKSNKTREGVEKWLDEYGVWSIGYEGSNDFEIVIAPSFPDLMFVSNRLLDRKKIKGVYLGVQDLSPYPAGKYTGAVSGQNLEGFNVKYAIVGHSERRRYFYETDNEVALKVEQAVVNGIKPVVCVDEGYIESQAQAIENELLEKCIVAYEPLEAIGTGKSADVGHVKKVVEKIKNYFGEVPVIYGGSVDDMNINEYLLVTDGVLVGGASLDVKMFERLISSIAV